MPCKVFRYIEDLDAFLVTDEYRAIADTLGLTEWNQVVWIGRLFTLDNDYGEHWFDNWDEREAVASKAAQCGIEPSDLLIIRPESMCDGKDGPCHSPEIRSRFWTDVLKSLELSHDLLFDVARVMNEGLRETFPAEYIPDLEQRIEQIRSSGAG
jgi:hypothetical protein